MDEKKVLLVDDEPDIRMYLGALIEDNGYEVLMAQNTEEALSFMERQKPNLICLDIMMPKKSGLAFYNDFKLDDRFKDIPTIFISAFSLARDFYGSGFRKLIPDTRVPEPEGYLEKPVKVDKLLEAIEKIIG